MAHRIPTGSFGYIALGAQGARSAPFRGGEDARFGGNMGEQRWGRAGFDRRFAGLPGGEEEGALADADAHDGRGAFAYGPPRTRGPYAAGGPKGYARPDARIREDVCERIAREPWLDAREVDVEVTGGEVVLGGVVASRREKHAIEDIAAAVPGVLDVENRLAVRSA